MDVLRGVAGMLAWGLFALASAAPALQARRELGRVVLDDAELVPRRDLRRGDAAYVSAGAAAAAALQVIGWKVVGPERALLVRLVALGAGLSLIGAAVEIALARHTQRIRESRERRLRRATVTFVLLALLGLTGVLFVARS
jgi:hypothetical protein